MGTQESKTQLPAEVWAHIFEYMEPFQLSVDDNFINNSHMSISESLFSNIFYQGNKTKILQEWTELRCKSRSIHDGIKYGVSHLDLSCLFPGDLVKKIETIHHKVNKGAFLKYPNFSRIDLTEEKIFKHAPELKNEFERQELISNNLTSLQRGFKNLKVLILDGFHKLSDTSLKILTNDCNNLEVISLKGCWNVQNFEFSHLQKLKTIRINASQIYLRLNLYESITKLIQEGQNYPQVEVEGGMVVNLTHHEIAQPFRIELLSTGDELIKMCSFELNKKLMRLFIHHSRQVMSEDVIARYELYENIKISSL